MDIVVPYWIISCYGNVKFRVAIQNCPKSAKYILSKLPTITHRNELIFMGARKRCAKMFAYFK